MPAAPSVRSATLRALGTVCGVRCVVNCCVVCPVLVLQARDGAGAAGSSQARTARTAGPGTQQLGDPSAFLERLGQMGAQLTVIEESARSSEDRHDTLRGFTLDQTEALENVQAALKDTGAL